MVLLKKITDKDLGEKSVPNSLVSYRKAARAIVLNDNKIAIMQVALGNYHKLPGGGIEEGEEIREALKREILEETGAVITIGKELGTIIEDKSRYSQSQESHCFIVNVVSLGSSKFTQEEQYAGFSILWLSIDEAIALFEHDTPNDYTVKFIRLRDLTFLKAFYKILQRDRSKLPFRENCEGYFFDKNGNVLAKEANGYLSFPGGGIDAEESPSEAIIREVYEETGAIIKNAGKVKELKFVWGSSWAKTEKQKKRYKKFQGENMHFFVGEIEKFEELNERQEDFWDGEKLIPIEKAIQIIESENPFDEEIREYREIQLNFLKEQLKR